MDIGKIINESIHNYHIPKKGCDCGCNTCHLPKSINESVDNNIDTEKPLKTVLKTYIRQAINELREPSVIIKIEGKLISDTTDRTQGDILSDIRSISGVTIVSSVDITPDGNPFEKEFYPVLLKIKIDPHPFIGKGGFNKEKLKQLVLDIKKIKGVRNFHLTKTPQITKTNK